MRYLAARTCARNGLFSLLFLASGCGTSTAGVGPTHDDAGGSANKGGSTSSSTAGSGGGFEPSELGGNSGVAGASNVGSGAGNGGAGFGGSAGSATGGAATGLPAFCDALPPPALSASQWSSSRAAFNDQGKLTYAEDAERNRIPDFAYAGYHYGELVPPNVAEVTRVAPEAGDDTVRIQQALNSVGSRDLDANGFRGAVILEPGTYEISGTLRINKSGVVLRGSGRGTDPTRDSIIIAKGDTPHQRTVIVLGSGDGSRNFREVSASRTNVSADFVQVSSLRVPVENAAAFKVGDSVIVRHPSTAQWIDALGGGGVIDDARWSVGGVDIVYYRRIVSIDGNTLELDAPVYNHLQRSLSQSYVAKSTLAYVSEVGVENLRIDIETAGGEDENHAWNAVSFVGAENAWVRDVTALHFGYAGVLVSMSTRISALNVQSLSPVAIRTGGRMYNLSVDFGGQLVLFSQCEVSEGRHGFVTNGTSTVSGIVFHRGKAKKGGGSEAGHRMWAQAVLYDNIDEQESGQVLLMNRGDAGTSHGWGAAHSVVWNYNSEMVIQKPPTAQNYAISQAGHLRAKPYNPGANGHTEIKAPTLVPNSLYEAQLCERLRRK